MRLLQLNGRGDLEIATYQDAHIPPYAILSHTWGADGDGDELTYDDLQRGLGQDKPGYAKVRFCGERAREDDLKHFWVDTCCINKSNSTELNEALNSMFRWYQQANKCYTHLQDVSHLKRDAGGEEGDWEAALRKSRWFTRGWTLQELLAPRVVEFWSRDGSLLGTKETLKDLIHEITGIPKPALLGASLSGYSVNERLRWAAPRLTTRPEDKAYCLFGIFDVFLIPIYGEREKAFDRLRKELTTLPDAQHAYSGSSTKTLSGAARPSHRELLASLDFDQIDTRHDDIKDAQRTTCEWLLQHPDYIAWNDAAVPSSGGSILWIAGKPGAGKSTLMKFALAQAVKPGCDSELLLSFFFNARGDELERTTLGMYRSLLLQLLKGFSDLQAVLDMPTHGSRSLDWTVERLQHLFTASIARMKTRSLKILVDALDECKIDQVKAMIEYFEDLGVHGVPAGSTVRICFASRHYPTININYGWRLVLEDQGGHAEDIQKYIKRRFIGKGKLVDGVKAELQEKANGIFLWVVLVVDILNSEVSAGRMYNVKERLRRIPTKLSDLLRDILCRDNEQMDEMLLCLQWVLYAKRPLQREEFYFAMEAAQHLSQDGGVMSGPLAWDPSEVSTDDMSRLVSSSSKGLAELTKSKKAPTVQFIHESVRGFLLDGGMREVWPNLRGQVADVSHEKLKTCCMVYLACDLTDHVAVEGTAKAKSERLAQERHTLSQRHPFAGYACQSVLYHANEAAKSVSQGLFISNFPVPRWTRLQNVYELHENRRHHPFTSLLYISADRGHSRLIDRAKPDRAWLRHDVERYQCPVIAAFANGHKDALDALLDDDAKGFLNSILTDPGFGKPTQLSTKDVLYFAMKGENYGLASCVLATGSISAHSTVQRLDLGSVLTLAAFLGDVGIVRSLLANRAKVNAQGGRHGNALFAASFKGHYDVVDQLLCYGADPNLKGREDLAPLVAASATGHVRIVSRLLLAGANPNARVGLTWTALGAASYQGHSDIVGELLNGGAEVDAQISYLDRSITALVAASLTGYCAVVRRLLQGGADLSNQVAFYGTALHAAALAETWKWPIRFDTDALYNITTLFALQAFHSKDEPHLELIKMLIELGADVNASVESLGCVLHIAAAKARGLATVTYLVEHGADINARGGQHGTALHAASSNGHADIVGYLLMNGADVDAQVNNQGTPLQQACSRADNLAVVKQLVRLGANVNARARYPGSALDAASSAGSLDVVRYLLEHGADVNPKDSPYGPPLEAASRVPGNLEVVKQLLDSGANVNAQSSHGTALHAALESRNLDVVRCLIGNGADVNARDGDRKTPLHVASQIEGNIAIVKQLLESGAKVNAQGYGGTALHVASLHGRPDIVKTLLENGADVDAYDHLHGTALHCASILWGERKEEVIHLLKAHGAPST